MTDWIKFGDGVPTQDDVDAAGCVAVCISTDPFRWESFHLDNIHLASNQYDCWCKTGIDSLPVEAPEPERMEVWCNVYAANWQQPLWVHKSEAESCEGARASASRTAVRLREVRPYDVDPDLAGKLVGLVRRADRAGYMSAQVRERLTKLVADYDTRMGNVEATQC